MAWEPLATVVEKIWVASDTRATNRPHEREDGVVLPHLHAMYSPSVTRLCA
jgi:hypothetical protein